MNSAGYSEFDEPIRPREKCYSPARLRLIPDNLKIARVIPLYKRGPRTCLSNYRPISLFSTFHKILEKLAYNRLIKFLDRNSTTSESQFGFRKKHSTIHALLLTVDKIQSAIEDGLFSCRIFLDLKKAFDSVHHEILIKKLHFYGIRGVPLQWFTSYLSGRKQHVSLQNTTSDYSFVCCGVLQGSVLGPLLFLQYINDVSLCSSVLEFHLFADTNLLLPQVPVNSRKGY